jgi:hypothetical protein
MRHIMLASAVLFIAAVPIWADEVKLDSPIESVALFKNGVAVVRRSAEIAGAGVYRVEDVPTPIHGTFWIESDSPVDVQVTMREIDAPERHNIDFQQELVGQSVTIHFKQGNLPVASGKVVALGKPTHDEAWSRTYERPQYSYYGDQAVGGTAAAGSNFLVLETDHGRSFVDPTEIAFLESDSAKPLTRQRVPVLLLTSHGDKKQTIHIQYLTKGIAWAPSYRVSLTDDKTLNLEQQAVVKNELADMQDAEISLISGYPSIQFSHVVSPMSLEQNWDEFFNQINREPSQPNGMMANSVAQQVGYNGNNDAGGVDLSAPPVGEGVDLHYESIGKRTMGEGDSLLVSVAGGTTTYDRVVEWTVPDTRDAEGRVQDRDEYGRQRGGDEESQPWDAVKFKNPLPFAMTTGPAMIEDMGHFAGQRLSYWVNAGEETTLHITKALSIRTRATEQEKPNTAREIVNVGGYEYRQVTVIGELTVSNHRNQDVNLVIRRQFSGDLTNADANPKVTFREEGVYSINRRNELTWTLPLKAGEEQMLHYEYTVLVRN